MNAKTRAKHILDKSRIYLKPGIRNFSYVAQKKTSNITIQWNYIASYAIRNAVARRALQNKRVWELIHIV